MIKKCCGIKSFSNHKHISWNSLTITCGNYMFIVQTSCRLTYRSGASDGRAGFDCCGEQSNLLGN